MFARIVNKRSIIGALLFLILVGEPAAAIKTGLFTPVGFVVLFLLYLTFFNLMDALALRFRLSLAGVVLVTFALYSVLITGLLHGEIADYILHPEHRLITTLIRVQCSFYTSFAFVLLPKAAARQPGKTPPLGAALLMFAAYVLLLTPSRQFGLIKMAEAFSDAPLLCTIFGTAGLVALIVGLRQKAGGRQLPQRGLMMVAFILFCIGLVPTIATFMVLIIGMIGAGGYYLFSGRFRKLPALPQP